MLAIDAGNTHITSAIFKGSLIAEIFRIPTNDCLCTGSFFKHLDIDTGNIPDNIVISSVRNDITDIILKDCGVLGRAKLLVIDRRINMGISNLYKTPETLGIDRIVNASAGYHLYCNRSRPLIVADMGTATTIDYITGSGEFMGGAIVPGIMTACNGLLHSAPELPGFESVYADRLIGSTTEESMRSGVVLGHAALIKGMVENMTIETNTSPMVLITGGFSTVLGPYLPEHYIIDKNLTLKGLSLIFKLNMC